MDDSRQGPGAQRDAPHQGRHDVGVPALDQFARQGQDGQAQVQLQLPCSMWSMPQQLLCWPFPQIQVHLQAHILQHCLNAMLDAVPGLTAHVLGACLYEL